jgi:alanyl-tRNA synthetase
VTTRIYFTDALAAEFDGTVVSSVAEGDRYAVVLDQTAFYPTSGGQPYDTGTLGGHRVLEVEDTDGGEIRHLMDAPLQPGARVEGRIDWPRRLDHMQQHTGQHVLSAAFDHLQHVRTVSFHLGAETSTIDLAREVSAAEIDEAEEAANRVVWEDRPVTIRFATPEEASRLPLRKEPTRTGPLRLIEVPDFDLSACGGTHVARTGTIGIIAVAAAERFKGATRVTFVCGHRALASYRALRNAVEGATRALSVVPADLGPAIERMRAEAKADSRAIKQLQEEVAAHRAATFRGEAETLGPLRGVLTAVPGWDAGALKTLALAIVSEPGLIAVLVGDGRPAPVVIARSADVAVDAGAWLRRATTELGGRGGGRPELAQGGIDANGNEILAFARHTLG